MLGIFLFTPSRQINKTKLTNAYLKRLSKFENTKYHWGGESQHGIDCSGLPRKSLCDALFAYGIRYLNSSAFRYAIELWWYDSSAKALGENYRNYTIPLQTTGTIQKMSYAELRPGDLAVVSRGIHILVYLGHEQWIQADPGIGAVKTLNGRTGKNGWFRSRGTTHRWTVLAD